ncbi:group I truncated hemoglobin [Croceicoccus mobilis]|nr:group 1 truncated hemoglobin [Croceicoccus mobilis]
MFEKYGGFAEVRKVVSAFYDEVLDDNLLQRHFVGVNMRQLIDHQTKMISSLLGGPAHLSKEELARAHRRREITEEDYDRLCDILDETLDDAGFEDADRDAVVREVENLRSFIVE